MLNEYVVVKGEGIYHKNDKSCLSPKEERMKWLKEVGEIREGFNVKMIHKCNSLLKLPVKLSTNNNNNNNRLIGKNISKLRNKSLNYDESVDKFTNSSLRNLLYNHSNNNSNINNSSDTTTHNESRAKEHKKTDALLYKVLGIRHKPYYLRQYNSISSSIFSPLSSSINNSINDFKDEYTFNNNNNELVFDNKQIIKVVPNMIVKSNNNIIEKEMNAEMERLRVRRNPFKIIGIDNKEVTLQHILMHKIGRNLDENGMEIKRKSEKGNNNKMVDFLAMDKYVEVVQRGRSCEERRILKGFKYRK